MIGNNAKSIKVIPYLRDTGCCIYILINLPHSCGNDVSTIGWSNFLGDSQQDIIDVDGSKKKYPYQQSKLLQMPVSPQNAPTLSKTWNLEPFLWMFAISSGRRGNLASEEGFVRRVHEPSTISHLPLSKIAFPSYIHDILIESLWLLAEIRTKSAQNPPRFFPPSTPSERIACWTNCSPHRFPRAALAAVRTSQTARGPGKTNGGREFY